MKKLSLDALVFQKGEVLTRSQLKKVLGGNGSDEPGSEKECPDTCSDDGDCTGTNAGLVCRPHGVYLCSNKPKGCYLPL